MSDDELADFIRQAVFYRARARRIVEMMNAISHPEAIDTLRSYAGEQTKPVYSK